MVVEFISLGAVLLLSIKAVVSLYASKRLNHLQVHSEQVLRHKCCTVKKWTTMHASLYGHMRL